MKVVLALALFACVAAMVSADGYGYNGPKLRKVYNGVAAPYNNADRQEYVNHKAEYKGASSGTARYEGVPGTGNNFGYYGYNRNYDGYNRNYDGYNRNYDGYGYDRYDNNDGYRAYGRGY